MAIFNKQKLEAKAIEVMKKKAEEDRKNYEAIYGPTLTIEQALEQVPESALPKVDFGAQIEELKKREGGYTAPENEAMWSSLANRLNAQQQAAQRALAGKQAQMGVRGGAGSAQLGRQQQQFAAQRAMAGQELNIKNLDEISKRLQERQQLEQQQQLAQSAAQALRLQMAQAILQRQSEERLAREGFASNERAAKKIICTELYFQGLMPESTFIADQKFGAEMAARHPHVMVGYHLLAMPIVKLMRKSRVFCKAVAFCAMPWAREMERVVTGAGKGSLIGKVIMALGVPLCAAVGTVKSLKLSTVK